MRVALLSDIHANLEAFEACLAHAATRGVDGYALLGDFVGYGADAVAVVETVMRMAAEGAIALKGNHDAAIERSDAELLAPVHWAAEIIGVLVRLDPAVVDDALLLLDDMSATLVQGVPVLRRAADMAISLEHHLFDTLYHAVALETGATLVTADEAYFNKAKTLGGIVRLADFSTG